METLFYFNKDKTAFLLKLYTSCTSEEISNDMGEGKGSLYTNEYIGKGNMDPPISQVLRLADSEQHPQFT